MTIIICIYLQSMQTLYSLLFDLRLMSISEKCNTVWAPLWWYYIRNFSFFLSLLYRRSKDTNFRRIVRCFAFSVKEQFMIATIVNLSFSDETSKQVSKIQKTVLKLSFILSFSIRSRIIRIQYSLCDFVITRLHKIRKASFAFSLHVLSENVHLKHF